MPAISFPDGDPLLRKQWVNETDFVAEQKMVASRYFGSGADAAFRIRDNLNKGYGREVVWSAAFPLVGKGTVGLEKLKGKEEAPTLRSDSMRVDMSRHAVPVGTKIDAQLSPTNLRKIGRDGLGSWKAKQVDKACANHLCGYTPANTDTSDVGATQRGHNPIVHPNALRMIRAGGITTDELVAADSTAKINLEIIDHCKERAMLETSTTWPIEPLAGGKHVMFLHPSQMTDLRRNEEWQAIQLAALAGKQEGNPLYKYALGEYNDTILVPWAYITPGVNSTTGATVANTRRAVFIGAEALSIAWGRNYDGGSGDWTEEKEDYGMHMQVAYDLMWGVKANMYNGIDYAKIVVTTYSATH